MSTRGCGKKRGARLTEEDFFVILSVSREEMRLDVYLDPQKCQYSRDMLAIIKRHQQQVSDIRPVVGKLPGWVRGTPTAHDLDTNMCYPGDYAFEIVAQAIEDALHKAEQAGSQAAPRASATRPAARVASGEIRAVDSNDPHMKGIDSYHSMMQREPDKSARQRTAVRREIDGGEDEGGESVARHHFADRPEQAAELIKLCGAMKR